VLHTPDLHEPLTDLSWDEGRTREAIRALDGLETS
jgi:hypothetical protein